MVTGIVGIMEAPKSALSRQNKRRKWLWILIAIAVVIVLIVIIVPTATILGGRHHPKGLDSSVLLPLYVYPLADAWDPLYRAYVAIEPEVPSSPLWVLTCSQVERNVSSQLHGHHQPRQWTR